MKMLLIKYITITFLSLVIFPVSVLGDVYKWKDENGKLHYGDKIPEQYKNQSEKVNVKDNVVNSVPKQKYTRNKKTSSDKSTAPKKMTKSSKSTAPKKMTKSSTCSKKWEKYNKSVACYDKCAIRLSNGGRDLVFCSKCVDVANPSCKIKN